jgi:hypothetical protein
MAGSFCGENLPGLVKWKLHKHHQAMEEIRVSHYLKNNLASGTDTESGKE